MRLSLLLISIAIIIVVAVSGSGIADAVWSAGTSRFGQVLSQNEQTSKIMEYYQATQNPDGYLQHLAQSTICKQRENQQACSTFSAIQGLTSGNAQSLITTFCSLQNNQQNELCSGYQKGIEAFGQFGNARNMFSNPGQAAQTYALGEMTKSVDPQIGQGIQTITTIQGKLNSLQLASSGNSDQLLETVANAGVLAASGERPSLRQISGLATAAEESTILESMLRARQCIISFNLDGSIQDINACKTTRETDISILMESSKQVLAGPDCNIFKIGNELSIIATENNAESGCYITMIDRENADNKVTYKKFIPREATINNEELRSGYFLFRNGELAKAIMLSSRNDNEITLGERKIIIGKGVLTVFENNENQLYYDYVNEYRGDNTLRLQRFSEGRWEDIGTIIPGRNMNIRQLENGAEISGEGYNFESPTRAIIINKGKIQLIDDGRINLMQNTEASIITRNGGAYVETINSEVSVNECLETYPRTGNIVDFCSQNGKRFFARGSGFNTASIRQITLPRRMALSEIAEQNNVNYQSICFFNNIGNCNEDTILPENSKVILPSAMYEMESGSITRAEPEQRSMPLEITTPNYGRIIINPSTECGSDDNCVFMRDTSQGPRRMRIDMVLLHTTDGKRAIDTHTTLGPRGNTPDLSVNYILDRPGNIIQEVAERYAAHHSGITENRRSVGIEIANSGNLCQNLCYGPNAPDCSRQDCINVPIINKKYEKFPDTEMKALVRMVSEILIRNNLEISQIRQHGLAFENLPCAPKGISANRQDPGPLFEWCKFNANLGVVLDQVSRETTRETINGQVTKVYDRFGLQNNINLILSKANQQFAPANAIATTHFEDKNIFALNTPSGLCISRTETCGIGSVSIISG